MSSENQQVLRLQLAYLMHRFLLIALGMGFLLPTAVNAESQYKAWMVLRNNGMTSIPMKSVEHCEEQGKIFMSRQKLSKTRQIYWCLASE